DRSLAKKPMDRFPDCQSFARAVSAALPAVSPARSPTRSRLSVPVRQTPAGPQRRVRCPQCGELTTCPSTAVATQVRCVGCGAMLAVPRRPTKAQTVRPRKGGDTEGVAQAHIDTQVTPRAGGDSDRPARKSQRWLLAGVGAVFLV